MTNDKSEDAILGGICLFIVIVIGLAWLWKNHPMVIYGLIGLALFITGVVSVVWYKSKKEEERQRILRAQFEKEQAEKGLVKFVDKHGIEHWGTPEEVERWKLEEKEEEIQKEAVVVKETIIKEIVKVRCKYCNTIYDARLDRCPHCGGARER